MWAAGRENLSSSMINTHVTSQAKEEAGSGCGSEEQRKLNSNYRQTRSTDVQQKQGRATTMKTTTRGLRLRAARAGRAARGQWGAATVVQIDRSNARAKAKPVARFAEQITPHLLPKY